MTADTHSDVHQTKAAERYARKASKPNGFRAFWNAAWIIGLPATFWIAVFEFLNYVLFFELSGATRFMTAGILVGLFTVVWALVSATAHPATNGPGD